ncbi:MAG: hypothetical protein RIB57_03635 [Pelagibacterium sp.]|jgi:hypothetical protein|uniref:hypothetical protein n=1 Tax=Pelagibacterium sp. TaxID=1967288 RepID=UPI0032EBAF73|tara:strand:- start:4164 stop:4388 length:225 start_codon:yes stop_codon:yes gene_type:complete
MAHNENSLFYRLRARRAEAALTATEPEWVENLRDFGLMASGVYQDLRGDTRETFSHFSRWLKAGLRKFGSRDER